MEVEFGVLYHRLVVEEDIPRLSSDRKDKIKKAIEEKLTIKPEMYGKPLRRSLKGFRKLRVGDYRVIYGIEEKSVKIFVIQHRSIVYEAAEREYHYNFGGRG